MNKAVSHDMRAGFALLAQDQTKRRRGGQVKSHCQHGHAMVDGNLAYRPRMGTSKPMRLCLACLKVREKALQQTENGKKRAAAGTQRRREQGISARYNKDFVRRELLPKLEDVKAVIRDTGMISAAYPVVGNAYRMSALQHFFPGVKKQLLALRDTNRHKLIMSPQIILRPERAADMMDRVNAAVSRGLPRDMRDDIISEMMLALLDGRLKPADIERRAREFVSANFRDEHNKFGPLSLDLPAFREGETPLIETIQHGMWQ